MMLPDQPMNHPNSTAQVFPGCNSLAVDRFRRRSLPFDRSCRRGVAAISGRGQPSHHLIATGKENDQI